MKKSIIALAAGLFASAAFAQAGNDATPGPASDATAGSPPMAASATTHHRMRRHHSTKHGMSGSAASASAPQPGVSGAGNNGASSVKGQ